MSSNRGEFLQLLEADEPGEAALDALVGTILDDKYRLLRVIGSGAMAHVYEAEQLRLGRSVAVKMLRVSLVNEQRSLDRFHTEALAASRVNHPHAVGIYDFGVTPDGAPYLVMEHLRGRSLADLTEKDRFPPDRIISVGAQILSALDEAHGRGVIHRDLKTENVVVETRRDGSDFVKVVDFGIAALVDRPDESVVGTPELMAPEQIRGEPAQPATDLYAMGILLYELVTGRTPFAGPALAIILERHLSEAPQPPEQLAPCPAELSAVILRALEKDPANRFASAADMRTALLGCGPRMTTSPPRPTLTLGSGPLVVPASRGDDPLGREELLSRVAAFCAGEAPAALALVGESGVGKASVARAAARRGERPVFIAGPDPSGLVVSWVPALSMIEAVLGLPARPEWAQLVEAVTRVGLPERDASGLAELFALPGPLANLEPSARRREAETAALHVLEDAAKRGTLCFLDVDRYDVPSRVLVAALVASNARVLMTSSDPAAVPPGAEQAHVGGLQGAEALMLFSRYCPARITPAQLIALTGGLPAAVVQLAGWAAMGNDPAVAPGRLVDLVAGRLGQLPAGARRLLQAVAAHGRSAPRALVPVEDYADLAVLTRAGLLAAVDGELIICDQVVAQVAAACTPAEARRALAAGILAASGTGLTATAVAYHAEIAGDLARALAGFLAAGEDAVRRFDDTRAASLYNQAVTLARRLQAEGDPSAGTDLVDASLRLAEVLVRGAQPALAHGCLDEAELVGPTPTQLAALTRQRGRIAIRSGQTLNGTNLLRRAIGLALRAGDAPLVCDAYLDLAGALTGSGCLAEAAAELSEAVTILTFSDGSGPSRLWELGWKLANLHLRSGHTMTARSVARGALVQAERAHSAVGRGRLHALLANLSRQLHDEGDAQAHHKRALEAAQGLERRPD